ncbi:MAG: hypothetical protein C0473_00230 [Cyanobacteria bacterium DS3.002]|nr:hypothetical protein [Cyanobacteria bacterium DS3.002]MBA4049411.1 hypothetical protein [Cyanobacteria bacterium DS2.008]
MAVTVVIGFLLGGCLAYLCGLLFSRLIDATFRLGTAELAEVKRLTSFLVVIAALVSAFYAGVVGLGTAMLAVVVLSIANALIVALWFLVAKLLGLFRNVQ